MTVKLTLFYQLSSQGFSETWYHPGVDPQGVYLTIPKAFYNAAASLRSKSCSLIAARFSSIDPINKIKSLLYRIRPFIQGSFTGSTAGAGPDVTSTTAVYDVFTANRDRRPLYLRGLADYTVQRDEFGNDQLVAGLDSKIDNYLSQAQKAGLVIRNVNLPPQAGLAWANVNSVRWDASFAPNRAGLEIAGAGVPFGSGTKLIFQKVPRGLPNFPRSATVLYWTTIGPTSMSVIHYNLPGGVTVTGDQMRCVPQNLNYSAIADWQFSRFSEHKTGRVFGQLRGRARAVR